MDTRRAMRGPELRQVSRVQAQLGLSRVTGAGAPAMTTNRTFAEPVSKATTGCRQHVMEMTKCAGRSGSYHLSCTREKVVDMKATLTRMGLGVVLAVLVATVTLSASQGGFYCNWGDCVVWWWADNDECDPQWSNLGNGECDIDFDGCDNVYVDANPCPGMSVTSAGMVVSVRHIIP